MGRVRAGVFTRLLCLGSERVVVAAWQRRGGEVALRATASPDRPNPPRATLELAFEVLPELRRFFEVTVAAEDTERHKPNPEPLLLALDRLGTAGDDAVYVGDSPFDVRAAKAAGIGSIAVTWGRIHSRERLEREAPDVVVETADELLAAF